MEKWFVASKRADFNKIGEVFHISPVTARLMRNRDLTTIEEMQRYLYGSLSDLYDPHLLKDADKGAEIIKEKIEAGKRFVLFQIMMSMVFLQTIFYTRD